MRRLKTEFVVVILAIATAVVSMFTAAVLPVSSPSSPADAVVVGTKQRYLPGGSSYTFLHGTSIVFEAPEIADWTFDHMEVDFGCEVGSVTGSNVSEVFSIENGTIQTCQPG